MKTIKEFIFYSSLMILTGILFTGCEQQNSPLDDDALNKTLEIAVTQAKIDDVSEGIDDVVDNLSIDFSSGNFNKINLSKSNTKKSFLLDCVIRTTSITETGKNIILDFGDGCSTKNGNILRGKIIISVGINFKEKSTQLDYTFDNFYYNDKKVEGVVHKYKLRVNDKGNPEVTTNRDIKIIWEDGSFVSVAAEKKREWIEGVRNGNWGDNVYLITGSRTITNKNGNVRTSKIIVALKRKMACHFLVSGIVEIQKKNKTIILNYGDGACDNLATATINGVEHEFNLKKRRKG
ncbi:MAG: hypothetical protein L3J34_06940 [Flavobacteriaceae bacterium]|nr:hypothetical protein [Flavobacteriaceae bacterium]